MNRLIAVIGLFVLAVSSAQAQVRMPLTVEVSDEDTMGYKVPFLGVGVGIEVQTSHLLLQSVGMYSGTDKRAYGNIQQIYGRGRAIVRFGSLGFGGGATYGHLFFEDSHSNRSATRPLLDVTYFTGKDTFSVEHIFAGRDPAYVISRDSFQWEHMMGRRLRLTPYVSYARIVRKSDQIHYQGFEEGAYISFFPF